MTSVFLSYARNDDELFTKRLYEDLIKQGFNVWWDRVSMPGRALTFLQEIKDAITAADRLVLVIGPEAIKSDYVSAEWQYALSVCKAINPVLRIGQYDILPNELKLFDTPDFRDDAQYNTNLKTLIRQIKEPVAPLGKLIGVPDLPPHFLARTVDFIAIKDVLLVDLHKPVIMTETARRVGVQGMGGVGKSVLAAAIARDCEIRHGFIDGVLWVTLGQEPALTLRQSQFCEALGDSPRVFDDVQQGKARLSKLLMERSCLLVLDDVWHIYHAEAFDALGPRCRLLITTRDAGIIMALGAHEHQVGILNDELALTLLAKWAGRSVEKLPIEAREVMRECANLPLALAMAGAMVREKPDRWTNVLHKFRSADLKKIRQQFPNYPYPDLLRAIQVSIKALEPEVQARYLDFALFPENVPIPESALQILWGQEGLDRYGVQDVLDMLVDRSLARRDERGRLCLHDLQFDYVRKKNDDPLALHRRLLEAYAARCSDGWPSGPNDGYFFEHLAYHLIQAGRKDELRQLLLDLNWLQAKLKAIGAKAIIADYDLLADDTDLYLVQVALRLSAHILAKDERQLRSQLYGRLLAHPSILAMLERIKQRDEIPWLRPMTPSLAPPDGPLMRTLRIHSDQDDLIRTLNIQVGRINTVAVTGNGRFVLTTSGLAIQVWDLESGKNLRTLHGHSDVCALAITPDGHLALSASVDGTLRVWDLETGEIVCTLKEYYVAAVALSPDGKFSIAGTKDGTLKVWDLETGEIVRTFKAREKASGWALIDIPMEIAMAGGVKAITVTPDGNQVISASQLEVDISKEGPGSIWLESALGHATVRVWDLKSGENLRTLLFRKIRLSKAAIAVTPNGLRAISAWGNTIKLWDIESRNELRTLPAYSKWICAVAITPDGHLALSASDDGTLRLWDLESCIQQVHDLEGYIHPSQLKAHDREITAVTITSNGQYAASASCEGIVKVWNVKTGENMCTLESPGTAIALTPDGEKIFVASANGTIKVWDCQSRTPLYQLTEVMYHSAYSIGTPHVIALTVTANGEKLFVTGEDGHINIWDLKGQMKSSTRYLRVDEPEVWPTKSDDNRLFDKLKFIVNVGALIGKGILKEVFMYHPEWIKSIAVVSNGYNVLTISRDNSLKQWGGLSPHNLLPPSGYNLMAVTPNGERTVSTSFNNSIIELYDLKTRDVIASFSGDSAITACAISANGEIIVAGETSGTVHLLQLDGRVESKIPTINK